MGSTHWSQFCQKVKSIDVSEPFGGIRCCVLLINGVFFEKRMH